jgi:hypothetical protein
MNVVRREKATADKRRRRALSAWPEARFKNSADAGEMSAAQRAAEKGGLNVSCACNDERDHHTKLTKRTKLILSGS